MPNWKKIVVGDAARLPSRHPRFYLDRALLPVVIFSGVWLAIEILGGAPSTWDMREVRISAIVFFASLFLASERLVLLAASFGYVALQSLTVGLFFAAKTEAQRFAFLMVGVAAAAIAAGIAWIKQHDHPYASKPSLWDKIVASLALFGVIALVVAAIHR